MDAVSLNGFIASYQTVTPLKLGELWAVPIMLRLALIENLRRVAMLLPGCRTSGSRDLADDWAERMVRVVEKNPTDLILVLADMARANPPLTGAFLSELTRHLQAQSPYFSFANSWLEHRLSDQGLTTELLVRADGQAQATDQVSMGNSITSLRFLSSNDWREFVEKFSLVEQILQDDPARVYADMDFATRDRYRHEVEGNRLEDGSHLLENSTSRAKGHSACRESWPRQREPNHRTAHIGYYLFDRGRSAAGANCRSMRLSGATHGRLDKIRQAASRCSTTSAGVPC